MNASLEDWQLQPHGTAAAARRHYRTKTPVCDLCKQHEHLRSAEKAAADVASGKTIRAVHADRGDGHPRCGVWNIDKPVIAAPGQPLTCKRCKPPRGN